MKTTMHKTTAKHTTKQQIIIGISVLLGILAVVALVGVLRFYQGADASSPQTSEPQASPTTEPQKQDAVKVIVYYFHGTSRCPSCLTIEELTREAVIEAFDKDLKNGLVEWKPINVEEPEHRHFIKDYQLYTKSVIVSKIIEGKEQRWKNLPKVWELLHQEKAFKDYVKKEIADYLKDKQS